MTQSEEQRLMPEEIRYLALEGGGGKGFAYLGAVQVLEDLKIMSQIKGVSGTSAGAITALMLSIGMTAKDVENELLHTDFNTFFDAPLDKQKGRRLVPAPFEYEPIEDDECEKALLSGSAAVADVAKAIGCLRANDSLLARLFWGLGWMYRVQGPLGDTARGILASLLSRVKPSLAPIITGLMRGLPRYLVYFDRDMGFFSGKAARDYFDLLLRREATRITNSAKYADPRQTPSMPFILHKKIFGTDLLICGANLSTGKSVLFSHKHTPYFPVADAVRISMSLPGFKPYVIRKQAPGWPPCGTYVDGGVWNNLPFREIGDMEKGLPQSSVAMLSKRRNTLGLRLEIIDPKPVLRGGDLISKLLELGLTAGESQVIADIEPFTIVLDTEGLETLIFKPPEDIQKAVTKRSRQVTYRYFGKSPPEDGPVSPEMLKLKEEGDRSLREARERKVCQ